MQFNYFQDLLAYLRVIHQGKNNPHNGETIKFYIHLYIIISRVPFIVNSNQLCRALHQGTSTYIPLQPQAT